MHELNAHSSRGQQQGLESLAPYKTAIPHGPALGMQDEELQEDIFGTSGLALSPHQSSSPHSVSVVTSSHAEHPNVPHKQTRTEKHLELTSSCRLEGPKLTHL